MDAPQPRLEKALVAAVLAIGVILRLGFAFAADRHSLVTVVTDDAFYYVQTARHIVAGHGSTFDGIHPTNGYHPLWMAVNLPIAALVADPVGMVRAVLAVSVACSLLTAMLLYAVVRRMCRHWLVPLLAVILYTLNARAVVGSLNGLETSLSTLLFTALLAFTVAEAHAAERPGPLRDAALGLLLGLLFLARTDNVFFAAAFFLAGVALVGEGARLRRAAIAAAVAAALAVPWVLWSWVEFGSPVQVSGLSIPYVHHELYRLEGHSAGEFVWRSARRFLGFLYEGLRGEIGYARPFTAAGLLLSAAIFARRWRTCSAAARRIALVLLGLLAASVAHIFVHTAIRWYPRPWYFDAMMVLLPAVFGIALGVFDPGAAFERLVRARRPAANPWNALTRTLLGLALAAAVAATAAASVRALRRGDWPWAREMVDAADWLRDNTAEGDVAAAFNAGIFATFSGRPVVNLDGAINNAAYTALRRKRLMEFMRQASVKLYVDFQPAMSDHFAPFFGDLAARVPMPVVHEIDRPDVRWGDSHIQIRRLEWPPAQGDP